MSYTEFTPRRFNAGSREIIERADTILLEYAKQGYTLTLRQLYYQFVSRNVLENTERNYKRLGSIISDARLAGLIDWKHMVDRTREVKKPAVWDNPEELLEICANMYTKNLWEGQVFRPEVWVEKDALIDIVGQACKPLQVPYFSCRGYASQSAMWEASERLNRYRETHGQTPVIIHLGDHDPSGVDMTRDNVDRLELFMGVGAVVVDRIALNMDQIKRFKPPPNPTKLSDSRASGYIKRFGYDSWELDAMEPAFLTELIERTIRDRIDPGPWKVAFDKANEGKNYFNKLAEKGRDE